MLPDGVPEGQTGPRLVAFSSLLMACFRQSKRRTSLFGEALCHIPCSTGLTIKHQNLATQALRACYEQMRDALPRSDAVAMDETAAKQANRKAWLLASQTRDSQADSLAQRHELQRQETLLVNQQDRLLNLRLADEVDETVFAGKQTELRDRLANIKLQIEAVDRSHDETAELASRVFELSQTLTQKWVEADVFEKRRILEIVFLNCVLDDVTLVPTIRKPFDVLAKGLISKNSRDDRI